MGYAESMKIAEVLEELTDAIRLRPLKEGLTALTWQGQS